MDLFEEKISSKLIHNGDFLVLNKDTVLLPNGKTSTREFVTHPGAACVVAVDEDDNILMVKQYRYPVSKVMYEVPAGKLDSGEEPINCARRELEEETGYKANNFDLIGSLYPAPAYSNEIIYIYLATKLTKTNMSLDEDEFLVCEKIKISKVLEMIMNGQITDAKTQIAVLKYLQLNNN